MVLHATSAESPVTGRFLAPHAQEIVKVIASQWRRGGFALICRFTRFDAGDTAPPMFATTQI